MGLLVEIRVSGDPIVLPEVAARLPDVTLEIEQWRRGEERVHWFLWARGDDLDRVDEAFAAVDHVTEVATVGDGDQMRLYRVSMVPQIELPPEHLVQDGAMLEGYVRKDGLHITAQVSGREIVRGLWEFLRERGISLETKRLRRTTEESGGRLTDPQFEALTTAYEMGYFDESTRVTQSEIADELGISRPSFSERLRRAEQRLVEKQLRHAD
jgi:predicted DNA binding protein